jgi:transposase
MKRFVEGESRDQATLFPEHLDDWIAEDNPVRAVDAFVDELNFRALGFESADPAATGRPAYHPATLLKIYIYGYLNRVQSSRRLERESQRNVELIWLTGRLVKQSGQELHRSQTQGSTAATGAKRRTVLGRARSRRP